MLLLVPQPVIGNASETLTGSLLLGLMAASVYTDLRSGRIPNWLTIGFAIAGVVLNALTGGLQGGIAGIEGWLLGAGLVFAFFALGVMGAGDVKLLAAAGAVGGPGFVVNAFVFTGIAGGIIALLVTVRRRQAGYLAASVARHVHTLVYTGGIVPPKDPKTSPLRFPYSLAIAIGTVAALFWRL